jgi:chromosome segregation ATPase
MRRHRKIATFAVRATMLSCTLAVCISCATPHTENAAPQQNLLFAEHSTMKKRLPLVERENDILTRENAHYRKWVRDLEGTIKKLTEDLAATQEKYTREIAAKREEIKHLEMSMQELDEEKTDQIAALNKAMAMQEKTFVAQREQILKQKQKSESFYSGQLADKEKALQNKALEIATLASAKADLEKALESKKQALAALSTANENTRKKLDETNEMMASLKKARDKSMAELESAKAANADLEKTFNELFDQLQLKEDQPGTRI